MQSIQESLQSFVVIPNSLFSSSYSHLSLFQRSAQQDRHLWDWGISTDDGFVSDDYISATIDTGWTLFIISAIISVLSILILPLNVKIGKLIEKKIAACRDKRSRSDEVSSSNNNDNSLSQLAIQPYSNIITPPRRTICEYLHSIHTRFFLYISTYLLQRWGKTSKKQQHSQRKPNAHVRELEYGVNSLSIVAHEGEGIELSVRQMQIQLYSGEKDDDALPSLCTKKIRNKWKLFMSVLQYDRETKRLLKLAVPFTLASVLYSVTDIIKIGIISQYLGTYAVIAYAIIDLTVGTSTALLGGFVEALTTLASMAYGAENYHAVGNYVQLGAVCYTLGQVPFVFIWGYFMKDIVLLFGFNEETADLAARFVWVRLPEDFSKGLQNVLMELLEVTDHEMYASVFICVEAVAEVLLSWLALAYFEADLVFLGLVFIGNSLFFLLLNVMISGRSGWLDDFEDGILRSNAFRNNRTMLKEFFKTSIPLSIGSLLAYAEWELLTGFAAVLGPNEAATWAILGYAWDVFESTTTSFADAGEVRVAHLLGKGNGQMAKLSAYKSMLMGLVMSITMSAIFVSLINVLPQFLTVDQTIEDMLRMLFPMIALSNVAMSTGMTCWSLVGAQLRYPLATTIATLCSFGITLPLGAIFTIVLNYDLKGLTFAVIVGYVMTAMFMTTVLLMSDWEKLSENVRATVGEDDSDSSDSDSSCSSSSDSS